MSGRLLILIAMLIAGGLAGCGATSKSAGKFHGDQARVAAVFDALSSAASGHDSGKICTKLLAPTVSETLKAKGGTCPGVVGNRLDTVDAFNLTVKRVTITGSTAEAQVMSPHDGKNRTDTFGLLRLADGTWRVASLR